MSMLTPPGMGGKKFRVTGDRYPRMRRPRHRRRVLAVVGSVAALGLLGFGTVQLIDVFTGDGDGDRSTEARSNAAGTGDCTPTADAAEETEASAAELPKPSAITVNIYNATPRTGLAQDTAELLEERGFVIGEVANAPEELDGRIASPGLLLGTETATASGAVDVLATQLAGAEAGDPTPDEEAATDEETDPASSVDLVLGDGFTELTTPDEAEALLAELAGPDPATPAAQDC
ncbi:LytR C-terminal domain-containing protein [Streptomyces profundus]|uniref:LytR C-terminal domain-containing protein n=1 Tax=Streptomyces profundus TaxID=2867410 RepID=UPI001D16F575|nr:LytR C-terminal domain-containing protein [Streptomyces sp. MA3_2.13]UED85185.1 LytR C-terminal domain-containing protein [Streptomyces sp. MA3_2.13]